MAYSLYDAAVTPCAQQLGALIGIIDKAASHCANNKIEESALLLDRLYPDMFCLARQIRQAADFGMSTGGRLAGMTPPSLPAVDDTSFADARARVETALGFVKSLTPAQVNGAEDKTIAWTAGTRELKLKGLTICNSSDCQISFSLSRPLTISYAIGACRWASETSSARSIGYDMTRSRRGTTLRRDRAFGRSCSQRAPTHDA